MITGDSCCLEKSNARGTITLIVLLALLMSASVLVLFGYLYLGYRIALHEWTSNGYDTRKPTNRMELERDLYLVRKREVRTFEDLEVGRKYRWNSASGVYEGWNNNDYRPCSNDSYVSYDVLGVAPIDVVFDVNNKVVLLFQSFDH